MKDGLKIIQVAGRYGYSVTRIGWLRRVSGDEYELIGARTVARTSGNYSLDGISKLAAEGMQKNYELSKPDKTTEDIHRLLIRRCLNADEAAWKEHCPKPKNWKEVEQ